MTKQHCKKYFGIGAAVVLIIFFLIVAEGQHQDFWDYYIVLYNRAYFVLLYLLAFLVGMVPIASKMLVPEAAIRHSSKLALALSLHKQGFIYALYYGGIFTAVNLLIPLVCSNNTSMTTQHFTFILIFFVLQVIGWFFAGSVFLALYALLRNLVMAYLIEMLLFITATSLAVTEAFRPIRYFMSIHEFMYLFFELSSVAVLIIYGVYYCLLSIVWIWAVYWILRRRDLLSRVKGG